MTELRSRNFFRHCSISLSTLLSACFLIQMPHRTFRHMQRNWLILTWSPEYRSTWIFLRSLYGFLRMIWQKIIFLRWAKPAAPTGTVSFRVPISLLSSVRNFISANVRKNPMVIWPISLPQLFIIREKRDRHISHCTLRPAIWIICWRTTWRSMEVFLISLMNEMPLSPLLMNPFPEFICWTTRQSKTLLCLPTILSSVIFLTQRFMPDFITSNSPDGLWWQFFRPVRWSHRVMESWSNMYLCISDFWSVPCSLPILWRDRSQTVFLPSSIRWAKYEKAR